MEQKRTGLSYVFTLAKEERGKLSLGMLLAVFSSALSFVPYLVVYQILLLIIKQEVTLPAMLGWAGIGIAAAVLQAILTSFAGICSHTAAFNTMHRIKVRVLEHMPTAVYLPPKAKVKFTSKNGCEARVYTAYCEEGNAPYFCPPEEIEEGEPGEYIYKRKYRFIFGQPGKHNDHITKYLIVGETVSVPGGWIGFPAHRHDYERPGKEVVLDEIFSFQMTSEGTGKGGVLQHGYDLTDDNKKLWDEVNVIEENNTAVALPSGYHTTVALPGTVAYLLWGLAGDEKKYKVQFDERYSWLEGCLY